jgi:hypothetical protein
MRNVKAQKGDEISRPLSTVPNAGVAKKKRKCEKRSPRVCVQLNEAGKFELSLPPDDDANAVGLLRMSGGDSSSFAAQLTNQLVTFGINLSPEKPEAANQAVNALIGALHGLKPRDELESSLIAQMATTHALAMETLARAANADRLDIHERLANSANKLMRTFSAQLEALSRYRGKVTQQKVIVEHVHVEAGGQAVVGAVQTGGEGVSGKNRE